MHPMLFARTVPICKAPSDSEGFTIQSLPVVKSALLWQTSAAIDESATELEAAAIRTLVIVWNDFPYCKPKLVVVW